MELKWKTYTHIQHPFKEPMWRLFWGAVIFVLIIYSILFHDYWTLIISFGALIFFFHYKFYEPKLMEIRLTQEGIYVDQKFYPWRQFYAFEIFSNDYRKFLFLFPNKISLGFHVPLEEYFVGEEKVREFLKNHLKEVKGKVPLFDRIYRSIYL